MSDSDPLTVLPHRAPFLFVTAITELHPGERAAGNWKVEGDEPFLAGHFPGRPLVPGALIAESMTQLAGAVVFSTGRHHTASPAAVAHFDIRFRQTVTPPATIMLQARLDRSMGALHRLDVSAMVDGRLVAEGSLVLAEKAKEEIDW